MLGNCEKMVLISSSTNQWPQNQSIDHEQKGLNLMGSTAGIMNEPASANQDQKPQQKQEPLKCPRCDSSNTKFCYYNNYSLSQPRHFCKACKRYWTRGGTLRNVPVGGGCRKNKRVKRPNTNSSSAPDSASSSSTSCANPGSNPPIFYGLPTNSNSDLNLPFSGFDPLQPQLNALGLGFSSADIDHRGYNLNGFSNMNSSSLLSGYSSIFANPSSNSLTSLLASKFTNGGGFKEIRSAPNLFENLATPFDHQEEFHVMGSNGGLTANVKEVKVEEGMKRVEWEVGSNQQNQTDQIVVGHANDPDSLYNNWSSTWHDPANFGSSITSLI